ncbi:hypothetical protein J4Q44_G00267320 [Coregonus suidteri]|uniref:Zinc finger PHD-type domain-containing protein n=1 Tax=Coregonus suidteri TaxID=861788 RepID=A0AAN8QUH3_9TELE
MPSYLATCINTTAWRRSRGSSGVRWTCSIPWRTAGQGWLSARLPRCMVYLPVPPTSSRAQKRKRKAPPVTSVTPPLSEDTCCARYGEHDPPASSSQECRSEVPWVCCDFCQHWFHCRCVQWDQEVAVELDFYCDFCDNIGRDLIVCFVCVHMKLFICTKV